MAGDGDLWEDVDVVDVPAASAQPELESRLLVLGRNREIQLLSRILLFVLAPGLFLLGALAATPILAAFGLACVSLGASLRHRLGRDNPRPRRQMSTVRVASDGVHVDGRLAVARAKISDGYVQPRSVGAGASIRLLDRRRRILFEAEAGDGEAAAILRLLGLDAASKRAEFVGGAPRLLRRGILFVVAATALLGGLFSRRHGVVGFVYLGAMLANLAVLALRSRIVVGSDAVLVRWLWRDLLLPTNEIARVAPEGHAHVRLTMRSGKQHVLGVPEPRRGGERSAQEQRDALLRRIEEAREASGGRAGGADLTAFVARGPRSYEEWLAALRKLARPDGGYRETIAREDALLDLVEDPNAPADARAGAAFLLKSKLDDDGKARIRVAAEATASPRLRVALDAAACDDEAAFERALAAIEVERRA